MHIFRTVVGAISLINSGAEAQATVFNILANSERIKFSVLPSENFTKIKNISLKVEIN